MKENKYEAFQNVFSSYEEMFNGILSFLEEAHKAGTWAFWRDRFGATHPDHKRDEIENPTRWAEVNFHMAKRIYCSHKDDIDHILKNMGEEYVARNEHRIGLFKSMTQIIEEEMSSELEKQILEDSMKKPANLNEEENLNHDLDEDEQYVAETEGVEVDEEAEWDGDDYVGPQDDDIEFED